MKKKSGAVVLLFAAATTWAVQVPFRMQYEGVLHKDNIPVNNPAQPMQFKLHNHATGGSQLWDSGSMTVPVANGVFAVVLGTPSNPISTQTVNGGVLFMETIVDGVPMSPRDEITSAAFALRAGSVDGLFIDSGRVGIGVDPDATLDLGPGVMRLEDVTTAPASPDSGVYLYALYAGGFCSGGLKNTQLWAKFANDSTPVLISSGTACGN